MKKYSFILLILVILLFALFSPYLFHKAGISSKYFDSKLGIGIHSTNTENQWHSEFHYLYGYTYGSFKAKTEHAQLIYSADIKQGRIVFSLYNAADSLIAVFSATNQPATIGNLVKGEKYWVKATAKGAKGHFDIEMK
jgi:uncharacterized protein YxeA